MTQIAPAKPASAFDNVKAWPTPAPASAGLGHNAPPLDQMIVMELNEALDEKQGFRTRFADIIAKGENPPDCEDDDRAGRYGDFIKIAKAAQAFIDGERTRIKAPYLEATRALDGTAKAMQDQLGDAIGRVKVKLDKFAAEQARKQREEAARIAAEQERMRREAQALADAERARLQAIADAEAAKERARLQAIEDARAAAEQREAAAVVVEAEVVEAPVMVEAWVPPAPKAEAPVFRGDLGARVGTKQEWKHKIDSVRQLPDALLKHPKVIEALDGVIKAQIRGGAREIKGCTIWPETVSSVR